MQNSKTKRHISVKIQSRKWTTAHHKSTTYLQSFQKRNFFTRKFFEQHDPSKAWVLTQMKVRSRNKKLLNAACCLCCGGYKGTYPAFYFCGCRVYDEEDFGTRDGCINCLMSQGGRVSSFNLLENFTVPCLQKEALLSYGFDFDSSLDLAIIHLVPYLYHYPRLYFIRDWSR